MRCVILLLLSAPTVGACDSKPERVFPPSCLELRTNHPTKAERDYVMNCVQSELAAGSWGLTRDVHIRCKRFGCEMFKGYKERLVP